MASEENNRPIPLCIRVAVWLINAGLYLVGQHVLECGLPFISSISTLSLGPWQPQKLTPSLRRYHYMHLEFGDQLYVDLENDMPGSVFELANALDRPLPQYHPRQLYMLVMSNWFERANAIIIHLGQCLQVSWP